jgi:hypothetical protein
VTRPASILFALAEQSEADRLARLLQFFGISGVRLDPAGVPIGAVGDPPQSRLLASASAFLGLIEALEGTMSGAEIWRQNFHSAFVYSAGDTGSMRRLVARLTGVRHPA